MPVRDLTVAYTGRPELAECWTMLERAGVRFTSFEGPFDLGISAAGSHIFTPAEIARARLGIVNLHLAPLPEFRGRFSATHAILSGARLYGVTLHYVDEGIDTGPIIAEQRFPIHPSDTAADLRARARFWGVRLFARVLPGLLTAACDGRRAAFRVQDESVAHYYDRFSLPAPDPSNPLLVRALTA